MAKASDRVEPRFPDSPGPSEGRQGFGSDNVETPAGMMAGPPDAGNPLTQASRTATVLDFHRSAIALGKTATGWIGSHERSLSAASMIGGFVFDNYFFRRIDLPNTQFVFLAYLALAGFAILLLHALAARESSGKPMPRWHTALPMATQFALGGLWSAFLVFYSRGAVLSASWPYLTVLIAIFLGNEVFRKYHSRLAFTAILYFFALFSYAIVTVPILTRSIGPITFLLSGIAALLVFRIFIRLVRAVSHEQWRKVRWKVAAGSTLVYAVLTVFYFTGTLPPLPIALADGGVYHFVAKKGDVYKALSEPQSWRVRFGSMPVVHLAPNESLYVYSAVFAPIKLRTGVVHRWMRYDPAIKKWRMMSRVSFSIVGGRDGGYRAYSIKRAPSAGEWRVDVNTEDGRVIGRVRFSVVPVAKPISLVSKSLS